jgi:hypothetical protein
MRNSLAGAAIPDVAADARPVPDMGKNRRRLTKE